jgi:hypothetical protein
MRRIISLAVVALGFFAGNLLQAQVRIPGAINSNESCCAIGMRGPSVPANSNRLVFAVTNSGRRDFRRDFHRNDGFRHDHFRNRNQGFGGFGGGYPIYYNPYGYDDTGAMEQPAANNYEQPVEDEGPGLTVFERRRDYQLIGDSPQYRREQDQRYGEHYTDSREDRKIAETEPSDKSTKETTVKAPEEVVSTILIFRDGSHREIRNYALMGSSIYDLSVKPGQGKMKILLADLDIPATIAANDLRGIDFKLPKQ